MHTLQHLASDLYAIPIHNWTDRWGIPERGYLPFKISCPESQTRSRATVVQSAEPNKARPSGQANEDHKKRVTKSTEGYTKGLSGINPIVATSPMSRL